jgi:hypothetical protein
MSGVVAWSRVQERRHGSLHDERWELVMEIDELTQLAHDDGQMAWTTTSVVGAPAPEYADVP